MIATGVLWPLKRSGVPRSLLLSASLKQANQRFLCVETLSQHNLRTPRRGQILEVGWRPVERASQRPRHHAPHARQRCARSAPCCCSATPLTGWQDTHRRQLSLVSEVLTAPQKDDGQAMEQVTGDQSICKQRASLCIYVIVQRNRIDKNNSNRIPTACTLTPLRLCQAHTEILEMFLVPCMPWG